MPPAYWPPCVAASVRWPRLNRVTHRSSSSGPGRDLGPRLQPHHRPDPGGTNRGAAGQNRGDFVGRLRGIVPVLVALIISVLQDQRHPGHGPGRARRRQRPSPHGLARHTLHLGGLGRLGDDCDDFCHPALRTVCSRPWSDLKSLNLVAGCRLQVAGGKCRWLSEPATCNLQPATCYHERSYSLLPSA